MLPSPDQSWVHAVDSRSQLQAALDNDTITAIETDLLMGRCTTTATAELIPIMAHPPSRESDLSMTDFFQIIANHPKGQQKVIKLDFKEWATVEPTLQTISNLKLSSPIFLNADILPGPGHRNASELAIPADEFMRLCLHYMTSNSTVNLAFSLGFKTDCSDLYGYTTDDLQAMAKVIETNKLTEKQIGTVLAINARQLAKNVSVFDVLLKIHPTLQLLLWTGKGELPIPRTTLETTRNHFKQLHMMDRIGFDCQVTNSYVRGLSVEFGIFSYACAKTLVLRSRDCGGMPNLSASNST